MSEPRNIPSLYLQFWEAADLLAFGAVDGGQQWRESKIKKAGLKLEDITAEEGQEFLREEVRQFLSAKKQLEYGALAGRLQVSGRRKRHSELKPIPQLFWENGEIGILGEDGGGAHPKDQHALDYQDNDWVGLRYLRSEIEDFRRQILQETSTGESPDTQAEAVEPHHEQEPAPDFKPGAQRKSNPLKDRLYKDAIEKVLRKARQEWPDARNRPPVRKMAKVLEKKYAYELSLRFEAIRQILDGTYPASRRLDIPGL